MKALVLAAGEGKRMWPLTSSRPKVMIPIANRPILEHLLVEVRTAGITEFIFIVGYKDEVIKDYFQDGYRWGVKIEYARQGERLGTADAVKIAENMTGNRFLLMNGDVIIHHEDITKLVESRELTLGGFKVDSLNGLGVVEVNSGKVIKIHEKVKSPPSKIANAGVYLLNEDIFGAISRTKKSCRNEYEITDSLQLLINEGHTVLCHELSWWLDLSYPWHLLKANEIMLTRLQPENRGRVEENTVIKGAIAIGDNSTIHSGSYIVGPVIIGRECEIGPNCYIRPYTAIGDRCHIGAAVEVKNSIIMNGTTVPHHNYVGDSIIGEHCNFGAGTKIANLRFDKKEVMVSGIATGRRKFGAVIGDRVQTGINASINTGSVIGDGSYLGPASLSSGYIESNSRVFSDSKEGCIQSE